MTAPRKDQLPTLEQCSWLQSPHAQAILKALVSSGHEARVVGGAVRNALMGLPVKDVDIATTATPPQIVEAASAAGLATFATGIVHGTITVVADQLPFEVTTLRRDVETDGRHAKVAFTSDWEEDASRRDFTINALYCDASGAVLDPLGGFDDVVNRRIRFIGQPEDRIREDYLRILRFFRFTAQYASGPPDAAGLDACTALKDSIAKLSGERRRVELLRILVTPRAPEIASIMQDRAILALALGVQSNAGLLGRISAIETAAGMEPDAILRLGAVGLGRAGDANALRDSLKLSSADYERLARMAMPDRAFDPDTKEHDAKAFLYRHGPQSFRDGLMLAWARAGADAHDPARLDRLTLAQRWLVPALPVRGADVLALGIEPGPLVGRILSDFEDWWIASGFPMTPTLLAKRLQHTITVTKS